MHNQHQDKLYTFQTIVHENVVPILRSWFDQPHVAEWWPVPNPDEYFGNFLKRIRSNNTVALLVLYQQKPIGYLQYYFIDRLTDKSGAWLPPLPKHTIGIDQFIGNPEYLGKGHGAAFIAAFLLDYLPVYEPQVTTVILDPDPKNLRAIRCYEKVGFYSVGIYTTVAGEQHYLMRYDL